MLAAAATAASAAADIIPFVSALSLSLLICRTEDSGTRIESRSDGARRRTAAAFSTTAAPTADGIIKTIPGAADYIPGKLLNRLRTVVG